MNIIESCTPGAHRRPDSSSIFSDSEIVQRYVTDVIDRVLNLESASGTLAHHALQSLRIAQNVRPHITARHYPGDAPTSTSAISHGIGNAERERMVDMSLVATIGVTIASVYDTWPVIFWARNISQSSNFSRSADMKNLEI